MYPEEDPLPGRPVPHECHAELHTDYGGAAVRWGLTHHKESAADCCQACLDQARRAKPGDMKCNIWVYCPSEAGCYSPDIYEHKHQECWLKYVSVFCIVNLLMAMLKQDAFKHSNGNFLT
jgi:PAN domain-containing protein